MILSGVTSYPFSPAYVISASVWLAIVCLSLLVARHFFLGPKN